METSLGSITLELDEEKAPITTKNFFDYVDAKYYDGTIFHRVIENFMIQGGGYDSQFKKKPTRAPIINEAHNGLKNEHGTIAMARTSEVNSATSQFFINVVTNDFLNHRNQQPDGYGYAVFGKVVQGVEVIDKIKDVPTGAKGPFNKDCPLDEVIIQTIRRLA
jgi:cyclophilin family peptidyl-prolyl cis-trans isomerase